MLIFKAALVTHFSSGIASLNGRLDIVTMMLEDDNVDANLENVAGSPCLDIALTSEILKVAKCREEHKSVCLGRRQS